MFRLGRSLLTVAALATMVVSMAACNNTANNPTPTATPVPMPTATVPPMMPTATVPPMPTAVPTPNPGQEPNSACTSTHTGMGIKVGLVTDIGGLNDKSFNHLACVGLTDAETQYDINAATEQSTSNADYVPNLTNFAKQNYDLVIAVGFLMNDAVVQVAKAYPHIHFAIIDDVLTTPGAFTNLTPSLPNVAELTFDTQQCGALVGYLAALLEAGKGVPNLQNKGTISTLGGIPIPSINTYMNGYIWGAHQADATTGKTTKVLVSWQTDAKNPFGDTSTDLQSGLADIKAGSDFLFQVDGGAGAGYLAAAYQKHVYGIGVDADQDYIDGVAASALKRVDSAVLITIYQVINKTFDSTIAMTPNQVFTLANNGVGFSHAPWMGPTPSAMTSIAGYPGVTIPATVLAQVATFQTNLTNGTIKVPDTDPHYTKGIDTAPTCKGSATSPC